MLRTGVSLLALTTIAIIAGGAAYSAWPPAVQIKKPEVVRFYDPLP